MRIVVYIMAFLVLALSCLPCADEGEGSAHSAKDEYLAASSAAHGSEHTDACSPFCHCACCASFSIHHHVAEITIYTPEYRLSYNYPVPAKITEISLPVWQPPQSV